MTPRCLRLGSISRSATRTDQAIADKDIDGVGSFGKTDKNELYSADRPANANAGSGDDDLAQPVRPVLLGRTCRPPALPIAEASGTDGLPGNNFPGYLVGDGVGGEGDWDDDDRPLRLLGHRARVHRSQPHRLPDTKCLRREDQEPAASGRRRRALRRSPSTPTSTASVTSTSGPAAGSGSTPCSTTSRTWGTTSTVAAI